ncbi:tRNA (adenosine(37)-N6)-dimethylallyltransferase MiaA [Enterovirga sp.]|uniref:tRNA (adenosine(37)-N6)-dimethylallyltransferase MiaA n=1 Tax=Enterovirga sp. TaxID=2026350 RepID=UPI002CD8470D|nr:tRNA (adenosine(37)-N6)-dimethylallyltransferase MiaA [Enterovirga sp.]HMO29262.1 tRNA (adenosine(37)-N6)-dimethylallyltransferase MiaA [Enterovirga sp.]
MEQAILIAGPTASGKSALALRLARERGGVVINADSMQVYRDLRLLSARPSHEEEAAAPHRLYGHVDGAVNYSAGRYVEDAGRLLAELPPGALPIFCGGTGLYFKALTEGLSALPPVPEEVRARIRAGAEGRPAPDLHAELALRDPEGAARLRPGDRQRILRALEIHAATGRPIGAFQGARIPGPLAGRPWRGLYLMPQERTVLRARIDRRFEQMIEAGALEEVRALAERGLARDLPIMRAHGVPGLLAHLRGEATLAEAIERGQADTRAYAKRQITWFRHQMEGWEIVAA